MLRSPKLIVLALLLVTIANDPQCGDTLVAPAGGGFQDEPVLDLRDILNVIVRVETRGVDIDQNGYFVNIIGETAQSGRVFAPIETRRLTVTDGEGLYVYEVLDVAPNCVVDPPHPRDVIVRVNLPSSETFRVNCFRSAFGGR